MTAPGSPLKPSSQHKSTPPCTTHPVLVRSLPNSVESMKWMPYTCLTKGRSIAALVLALWPLGVRLGKACPSSLGLNLSLAVGRDVSCYHGEATHRIPSGYHGGIMVKCHGRGVFHGLAYSHLPLDTANGSGHHQGGIGDEKPLNLTL